MRIHLLAIAEAGTPWLAADAWLMRLSDATG